MDVQLVLCDWAETVNAKLYIMGAGWTKVIANQPAPMAVAVIVLVPWTDVNKQHSIELALLTEDGEPVVPAVPVPPEVVLPPIRLEGKFEVGRPPGSREGAPLPAPFAFRIPALPLNPGSYVFQLSIDGNPVANAAFVAEGGPSQTGAQPK